MKEGRELSRGSKTERYVEETEEVREGGDWEGGWEGRSEGGREGGSEGGTEGEEG
jgi:hypothetical protein